MLVFVASPFGLFIIGFIIVIAMLFGIPFGKAFDLFVFIIGIIVFLFIWYWIITSFINYFS